MQRRAAAITARIAATKQRLLKGGLLQPVEWGVPDPPRDPPDPRYPPDVRGRRSITWSMLDAFIADTSALDRSTLDTSRSDEIVLLVLDAVAIFDDHLFRYGDPTHIYKIQKIDGVIKNEATGVRFSSEIVVVR